MILANNLDEFVSYRKSLGDASVGFVPTMGALHAGHGELVNRSVRENDKTVLSIYVNQTQFNNSQDLDRYPRQIENDLSMAKELGVDVVFTPSYETMYPDDFKYQIDEKAFSRALCGAHRPGHFVGVMTVVMKLFNIVEPHRAYFGEKDFQQLTLVQQMVKAFFLNVEVVGVPTVREDDGLAMSSRNLNLSDEQRAIAPELNRALVESKTDQQAADRLTSLGFDVDYIQTMSERRLAAAALGSVRLIDNVAVNK